VILASGSGDGAVVSEDFFGGKTVFQVISLNSGAIPLKQAEDGYCTNRICVSEPDSFPESSHAQESDPAVNKAANRRRD